MIGFGQNSYLNLTQRQISSLKKIQVGNRSQKLKAAEPSIMKLSKNNKCAEARANYKSDFKILSRNYPKTGKRQPSQETLA